MNSKDKDLLTEINDEILEDNEVENYNEDGEVQKKEEKKQRKAQLLWEAVQKGNTSNLSQKVASILNRFPETRKSDITLQIRFWEQFQGFNSTSVSIEDLYKLERLTSITRARAKIQNEFKLFLPDEKTKRYRRDREEIEKETALLDKPSMPILHIYADETGKTDDFIIIGSIWVLDHEHDGLITQKLSQWTTDMKEKYSRFPKEFHFKEIENKNEQQLKQYKAFFDQLISMSDKVSFRAIAVNKAKITMKVDDIINDLFFRLVKIGVEHELYYRRIELPKQIMYVKDMDSTDSSYNVQRLSELLISNFKDSYDDKLKLNSYQPIDSRLSRLIQQSDIFTASLNRVYNHRSKNNTNNNKDKLADYVLDLLDIKEIRYSIDNLTGDIEDDLLADMATIHIFE